MNVFKEMALSIYSFESYRLFLKNKKGKVFGFGMLLVTIYFAALMIPPGINDLVRAQGSRVDIPNLRLEDGTLWVDDVVEIDTGTTYIHVDTNPGNALDDKNGMQKYFNSYNQVLFANSEKMFVKNGGQIQEIYFSDLDLEFDREDLEEFIPWAYAIYAAVAVFVSVMAYIGMALSFFFGVLFVALMGMIAASGMKYRLTFGQLYLLGVYSRTLPLLIKVVVSYLPFHIPLFWVINFGISLCILVIVIQKLKEQENVMQ